MHLLNCTEAAICTIMNWIAGDYVHFEIKGKLDIGMEDFAKKRAALQRGGSVQCFIDSEVMRYMSPLMPRQEGPQGGTMINEMITNTVVGSGYINVATPYARFQHEGKVMIYEPTGSTYAPANEGKIVIDKNLEYNGAPDRRAFYFERMKRAHEKDILKGAQEVAKKA